MKRRVGFVASSFAPSLVGRLLACVSRVFHAPRWKALEISRSAAFSATTFAPLPPAVHACVTSSRHRSNHTSTMNKTSTALGPNESKVGFWSC